MHRVVWLVGVFLLVLATSNVGRAAIITVDFTGATGNPSIYTEDGFRVSSPTHLHLGEVVANTLMQHNGGSDIYNYGLVSGGAFDLLSFDILSNSFNTGSNGITFVSSNGATFSLTSPGTKTFSGPGWTNITNFSVNMTNSINAQYTIDNIRVEDPPVAAVPEPASLAIWTSIGIIGLVAGSRLKRKRAAWPAA